MRGKLSLQEAKERVGRFCSLRERSPHEVDEKLKSWGLSETERTGIIDRLTELNFINEQRFANAYCHDKFEFNSWGKQKIRTGIYSHKIPNPIVQQALDRIDEKKYQSRLLVLGRKKWEKLVDEDPIKRKQKTVNYLGGKGYELDLVWRIIEKLESTKSPS